MSRLERYKVCPSCGAENVPNAADCTQCGFDILMERVERRQLTDLEPISEVRPQQISSQGIVAGKPCVVLESLADPKRSFVVYEGQTIGRADLSDVIIEGIPDVDSVSRRMALIGRHGTSWYVQHVGQTNYIAVDGEEYDSDDEVTIREGSVLGLALCQFFIRIPEATD